MPLNTYTVEYNATGALDGTSLAPNPKIDPGQLGPGSVGLDQVFDVPLQLGQDIGLFDPDFGGGLGGSQGDRQVQWFRLVSDQVGDATAQINVVDASGVLASFPLIQLRNPPIAGLAGASAFYTRDCIEVPQGAVIQVRGFPLGAHRIKYNVTGPPDNARDEALLASACCCEETGSSAPCEVPEINTVAPDPIEVGGAPQTITITGTGFLSDDIVQFLGPQPAQTDVAVGGTFVFTNSTQIAMDGQFALSGTYDVVVRRASDPSGCFAILEDGLTVNPPE